MTRTSGWPMPSQKLSALAASDVRTIVDPTVIGLGRYIPRIQRIAEQVPDLNIVVATGCYTYRDVPFFFHYRGPALEPFIGQPVPEPMVDMFVGDIVDGIAGTGVKAGMLKCAIDHHGLTTGVERVMRAVAVAHRQTGVPITLHTHPGTQTGLAAQQVLADEGVDPHRVVLGHSGDTTDADHLQVLADAGFVLGMDRFGVNLDITFEARCDVVVELCRRGYTDRMVLSHDAACYIDWIDPAVLAVMSAVALPPHRTGRAAVPARPRRHRRPDRHDAGGQPAPVLRAGRKLLTTPPAGGRGWPPGGSPTSLDRPYPGGAEHRRRLGDRAIAGEEPPEPLRRLCGIGRHHGGRRPVRRGGVRRRAALGARQMLSQLEREADLRIAGQRERGHQRHDVVDHHGERRTGPGVGRLDSVGGSTGRRGRADDLIEGRSRRARHRPAVGPPAGGPGTGRPPASPVPGRPPLRPHG